MPGFWQLPTLIQRKPLLRAKQWGTQEHLAQCLLANVEVNEQETQKVADEIVTPYWGLPKAETKRKPGGEEVSAPLPKRSKSQEASRATASGAHLTDLGGEMILDLSQHIRTNIHEAGTQELRNHLARMRTLKGQIQDQKFHRTTSHESMEAALTALDSHIIEGETHLAAPLSPPAPRRARRPRALET